MRNAPTTIFRGHRPSLMQGVSIVIDVIRAFTTTLIAFKQGVDEILLVDSIDDALQLREQAKESGERLLLAGERGGLPIPGFDFGNSPAALDGTDLRNVKLVLTTTNGVTAARHAAQHGPVYVTGFSNARETADYVRAKISPDTPLNIVASHPSGDDDLACAEYIIDIVEGDTPDLTRTRSRIINCAAAQKFHDPKQPEFAFQDLDYCGREEASGFVMVTGSPDLSDTGPHAGVIVLGKAQT